MLEERFREQQELWDEARAHFILSDGDEETKIDGSPLLSEAVYPVTQDRRSYCPASTRIQLRHSAGWAY